MIHNMIGSINHNGDSINHAGSIGYIGSVDHIGDKEIKESKEQYQWLNKIVEIHNKYGLKHFSVMGVRSHSKEDSLELVNYIYKDFILNSDRYPELKIFAEQLEKFTIDDRLRAVGFILGLIEGCGDICMIDDVIDMAREWSLEDKLDTLLPTFFRLR